MILHLYFLTTFKTLKTDEIFKNNEAFVQISNMLDYKIANFSQIQIETWNDVVKYGWFTQPFMYL